jgi:hypothetical protein
MGGGGDAEKESEGDDVKSKAQPDTEATMDCRLLLCFVTASQKERHKL